MSAGSARALERLLAHVELLRDELRLGARSAVDVDRQLRRLTVGPVTLERAVEAYAARPELSPHTRRRVRSWLQSTARPLRDRELDDLDVPTLSAWLERVRTTSAPSTVSLAWRTLRGVVRFAAERGWIGRSPWGAWRPSSKLVAGGRALLERECCRDEGELRRLLVGALAVGGLELQTKIATAAGLGLRNSELAELRWADVDAVAGVVTICGKGRKVHRLQASAELLELLGEWRDVLRTGTVWAAYGPVFPDPRVSTPGKPRRHAYGAVSSRQLRSAVLAAGLPSASRWSPHSLRDTFATLEHARTGGDLGALMARTRHASIASLARYLRPRARGPLPQLSA